MIPSHPGQHIAEELAERGRSQKYFAELIEKSPEEVNYIITGKRNINVDWACRLSVAFGTSIQVWLNMQNRYDIFLLEHSEKNVIFDRIKERTSLSNQQLAIA